ncbi:Lnb N-terminal periplasmic domain-containing protein [Massilia antarctica]|uniref:Lnb N-terminal periplasmic domain-containing protein n=1 Tax=Massilia antarctica TaxID=2765360 RepID=UPI0006BB5C18|nr:DUF4105 domain-containing protein [Massilia sp. H27-R4]MCY0915176.1 DUF4105 domain-containing protein [Massilia sp. H27-R4]CUI07160.1 putative outermembrane protein [Janthinobacterium sp. CG23_2]CUU30946.1 putative outermembrane protein [Janthinobacterium sp. CG23_2]
MSTRHFILAGTCLGVCASHPAQAVAASLQSDARLVADERIAQDPGWLALLHYRERSDGSMRSQADQPEFFLSPEGKNSPAAELLAGVAALHAPAGRQDFACRFPARYEWLRTRLGHDGADDLIGQCPQLSQWLAGFPGQRISINFASGYLENPSSTFGHTFLKIYRQSGSELLSPTINYAARTDARDGALAFVFKGLFGGFPGVADELPFYRRLRTYTESEGRDIHEYELALTPGEVRKLLLHTWEIKDGAFDYAFLHENCAYRTLTLIDVVRPHAGLLKRFGMVTVPVDTIRALRHAGMLGAYRVWPSAPKRVRDVETQVPAQDATAAHRIALGQGGIGAIGRLPAARRAGTLQLAYEYASVLIDRDEGERATRKAILGAITRARLELDDPEPLASRSGPATPEDAHDGGLIGTGLRQRAGQRGVSLEYAAFQHTLTNPLAGYEPHAEITVLNPELQVEGKHARLRRIDWLVAQSTIPASTLFQPRAWRLQLATRSETYAGRDHMATSLAYHSGMAWALGSDTVFSLLPGARIETGGGLPHHAGVAGALQAEVTRQGTQWSAQLALQAEKFIAGSTMRRLDVRATGELRLSRNLSVALGAGRTWAPRHVSELNVSLKWRQRSLANPLGRD